MAGICIGVHCGLALVRDRMQIKASREPINKTQVRHWWVSAWYQQEWLKSTSNLKRQSQAQNALDLCSWPSKALSTYMVILSPGEFRIGVSDSSVIRHIIFLSTEIIHRTSCFNMQRVHEQLNPQILTGSTGACDISTSRHL